MQQLALDIRLADHAVFDSFHVGPNAAIVASLQRAAAGDGTSIIWIWGGAGAGKSHLLQASVARAYGHGHGASTAYLPLAELRSMSAGVLEGIQDLDLVALDDPDTVAGDAQWERALFRLYEGLVPRGGRLLVAGRGPPAQAGFVLPDLRSRLSSGVVFRLEQMSDEDSLRALQLRATWRGFALPDETGRFLLGRVERSTASLFQLLDRLDQAALVAQKRLTVPFVKAVLDSDPA